MTDPTPSSDDAFVGSDEIRSAGPLPHVHVEHFDEPLELELGRHLPHVDIAFETFGRLSETRDNAVLLCHALTGDSHVASHGPDDEPGWWELMVGRGKPVDTDRFFVVCPNVLGGCRGTTGPNSVDPRTGKPYGQDFPAITVPDMVRTQRLLLQRLGIEQLLAVIGGSMGGHMALCWAQRYPTEVRGIVALATSPRLTSQSLAFDIVGRNAIRQDPHFHEGQYYDQPDAPATGLAIARMLGHITYLSPIAMSEKFEATRNQPRDIRTDFEKEFSVGSYLAYKGQSFTERFDANSYITLSMAMDRFDLGADVDALRESFADNSSRWLVASFTSDWLFPSFQSKQLVASLLRNDRPVSFCDIESSCGHDAFLLEDDLPVYGEMTRAFLANLLPTPPIDDPSLATPPDAQASPSTAEAHAPTSIFHEAGRLDYDTLLDLIEPGLSVLDVGCGEGGLLARLAERGHRNLQGVEIDQHCILTCIRRGLDVVQRDVNKGLTWFGEDQFDVVVLSQTLQTIYNVRRVMEEMVRVGRRCVVSVPNFGYYKLQDMIQQTGRTPEAALLHFKWYDTPNIRILTLKDFEEFCGQMNLTIHRRIALDTEAARQVPPQENPNRHADIAVFVVSK
jgi:homoserine O-acetyltransferase/O-succinyltransferase